MLYLPTVTTDRDVLTGLSSFVKTNSGRLSPDGAFDAGSLDGEPSGLPIRACWSGTLEIRGIEHVPRDRFPDLTTVFGLSGTATAGVVESSRSDDPACQPVSRDWFVAACRASLLECETVVTLAARQSESGDEESLEFGVLKETAAQTVSLIAACLPQLGQSTALARDTWRATACACERLAAQADRFPFDGWATRCGAGCRLLAAVAWRACRAGVEVPTAVA